MQERLVTRFSGPDKGWKPAFLNPDRPIRVREENSQDLWLIDGELPTSTGAASSLMKSSPGCSRAKISPEEKTFILPS
ncbi:hypothetical protein TSUD_335800 [Trifolium subterraneum]|uniref:Uncharacterized protein n=1 Tax=Trifolium subterraneum TaxID=3900 RepID=A0A2Z6LN88_TRISU|nr:hypothetical protein TSUD_335800 [Trifolium subterraneum]